MKDSQNMGDKVEGEKMSQGTECQQAARQQSINASPPSASSSPSHEFSFTISLHQPPTLLPEKAKSHPSFAAVDLSPADDIFFHGHLLPLGLLSQSHPLFPRSSTSSLPEGQKPSKITDLNVAETKEKPKAKSFSLFGLSSRRNGFEVSEIKEENSKKKQKLRKLRFNMSHVLKGYIRLFRPLWSFKFRVKKVNIQLRRKTYSFSGGLSPREKEDQLRGRRSAPASMRTSPGNSRTLVLATVGVGPAPSASSASTMEELQAAIQAAIAHCKNSIAMAEEKIQRS
ncbi:BRI1 kinase inhibitor 1-like [Diospyros lotus]|uniref:BRI1 kinase inhibitor 1-like n=1 Tax=Diospyros lotus TaxID=55363 RepID=UPI00225AD24B|nr:BRI1 kinase inhibitor 1-like [Diospyros lotus]